MTKLARAAVLPGVGQSLEIRDDIEVGGPQAGEVRVTMAASGVCHSDLSVQNGTLLLPTPIVLGHEGAGVVAEVGAGVAGLSPGDNVVVGWVAQCGRCWFCNRGQPHLCSRADASLTSGVLADGTTRLSSGGRALFQMTGAGTFSSSAVVSADSVVKIPPGVDPKVAALLGCAVLTGVGAALHSARIVEGDTVAVIGCGGVGLNVIQGALIAGAATVVAVDIHQAKMDLAEQFGATIAVDSRKDDPVSAVMAATAQRGADVVFEVVGSRRTIDQSLSMARRGGQVVVVGIPSLDVELAMPAFLGLVLAAKTVSGCWYGSSDLRRDVPYLLGLYQKGALRLDELVSAQISLEQVNEALAALAGGEVARSVIVYDKST